MRLKFWALQRSAEQLAEEAGFPSFDVARLVEYIRWAHKPDAESAALELGISQREMQPIIAASFKSGFVVAVGFNWKLSNTAIEASESLRSKINGF